MLRVLIWAMVIFMAVKIARIFMNWRQYGSSPEESGPGEQPPIPPFSNVQEADFEDITPDKDTPPE